MQIFLSLVLSDVRVALFGMFILCVEYIHIHIQTRAKSKRAKENEAIMYVQRDDRAFECKRFDAVTRVCRMNRQTIAVFSASRLFNVNDSFYA